MSKLKLTSSSSNHHHHQMGWTTSSWILVIGTMILVQFSPASSFTYQNQNRVTLTSSTSSSSSSSTSVNNSRDRQGCFWVKSSSSSSQSNNVSDSSVGNGSLECHVRTLNVDFLNLNATTTTVLLQQNQQKQLMTRQDFERAQSLRVKCNDKLFFDSFLLPNQTLLFTLPNLRSVEVESCKIRRLPGNVWTGLGFLKSLSIQTKNGEWSTSVSLEVENEAFEGLSQLTRLDLSWNNIYSLPERTFCPLRSLSRLNVSHNSLTELEELNWSERENYCMLGVQSVDLSFNSIRRIGKIFKWKKITELYLQNNYIEELDDAAFAELSVLMLANLSSNRLVALPPTIFRFNKNIREIYLSNNSISALAPAVFAGLDQLMLLDLSRNTLTSQWIREKMFHGLSRLVLLRLSFNQLSYVDSSIFKDLISLQSLNLDNNRIETISPDAFGALSNLQVIDLSNNRISALDSTLFAHLFLLRQLYLDHNKIRQIDDNLLTNCTNLQDLGLADNLLLEVPVALRAAVRMQTLDIGENRISSLTNTSFLNLGQLFGLRIVDNRLTELPRGFCDPLKKLRVLNLAQNRLSQISPGAFLSCPELRALRLDTNALEDLPTSLVPQLPSLLWLNVSVNRLSSVDYRSLPRTVEWLDLSHNSIESVGGLTVVEATSSGVQLRILDLSYNKLSVLDHQTIPGTLETLRVNHNKLKLVQADTFIRSSGLRRVELVGNLLETLPLTALRFPPIPGGRSLPEFYLSNNPFRCDCSMELNRVNQLSVLRQHPRIMDLDTITCSTVFSRNQTTIKLRESRADQFLCPYKSHCFALCHCCDFEFCDCAMTCPSNCTCYHDVAWSRNIVDCSNGHHQDIPPRIPMDVTELYLDGNSIPSLSSHIFIGKKHARLLFLNHSGVEFIRNKTFNGLKSLEILHLGENLLTDLQGFEFTDLDQLRQLHLQNNLLSTISPDSFSSLKSLEILRLHGNHLMSFNVWELGGIGGNSIVNLKSLTLSENPWSCNCEFIIAFRTWIFSHSSLIPDLASTTCRMVANQSDDSDNNNNNSATTTQVTTTTTASISTICHGPSERLVNNGNFASILSDHHQVNANQIGGGGGIGSSSKSETEDSVGDDFSSMMTVDQDEDDEADEENDSSSSSSSSSRRATGSSSTDVSNMRTNNNKSASGGGSSVLDGGESDSGVFWTLLLTCGGFILLLLILVILFRREIYERLNDKVNMFLFCSSASACCCCCRPTSSSSHHHHHHHGNGTNKSKKSSSSSSHHLHLHSGLNLGLGLGGRGSSHHNHHGIGGGGVGEDTEKLFDAYFLYSKLDEEILEKLTPELEHGMPNFFRLCLHYRDLCLNPLNPWNIDMIQSACDSSKRVVLVLSQNLLLHGEWQGSLECRQSLQFVMSRGDIQKKLIIILLPPLSLNETNLTNLLMSPIIMAPPPSSSSAGSGSGSGAGVSVMNLNIMNNKVASLLKSSTLEWTDRHFWSKFKLLLPTPLHSSMSHAATDHHPMLIPATYTISRQHSDYHSHRHHHPHQHPNHSQTLLLQDRQNIHHHQQQQQETTNDFNRSLDFQRGLLANTNQFNSRNPLIPPSYDQSSPPPPPPSTSSGGGGGGGSSLPLSFLSYANTSNDNSNNNGRQNNNRPPPPPPSSGQLWQTGLKEQSTVGIVPSQIIGLSNNIININNNRAIHPIPPTTSGGGGNGVPSFNESFRRHQQAHLDQHQAFRLVSSSSSSNKKARQQQNNNNSSRHHHHQHHEHQDSNCSNISNNSRRPLNASPGYSSSVETNISSSNEELDHVYSTIDTPHHHNHHNNHNHHLHHTNSTMTNQLCCAHLNSNNNSNDGSSSTQAAILDNGGGGGGGGESLKLNNPYSPTNINNNGDPTMYFV